MKLKILKSAVVVIIAAVFLFAILSTPKPESELKQISMDLSDVTARAVQVAEQIQKRCEEDKAYMMSNNNQVVLSLVTNAIKWRSNCVALLKTTNPDHPLIAEATVESGTKDRPESFNLKLVTSPKNETNHITCSIYYRSDYGK